MKLVLTFILALFALTAAVPASAVPGNCSMPASSMQRMAMPLNKSDGKKSCCDHPDMGCAIACDAICAACAVAPAISHVQSSAHLVSVPAVPRQLAFHSVNYERIDPPPKIAG